MSDEAGRQAWLANMRAQFMGDGGGGYVMGGLKILRFEIVQHTKISSFCDANCFSNVIAFLKKKIAFFFVPTFPYPLPFP